MEPKNEQTGFTLLELIVTLVISSIMMAGVLSFTNMMSLGGNEPISAVQSSFNVNTVMVGMECFFDKLEWKELTSYGVGTIICPQEASGKIYRCTQAGKSGPAEPGWPGGGTLSDGTVVWAYHGAITEPLGTNEKPSILHMFEILGNASSTTFKDDQFGKYYLIERKFIKFDGALKEQNAVGGDTRSILKITIKDINGQQHLTTFFG